MQNSWSDSKQCFPLITRKYLKWRIKGLRNISGSLKPPLWRWVKQYLEVRNMEDTPDRRLDPSTTTKGTESQLIISNGSGWAITQHQQKLQKVTSHCNSQTEWWVKPNQELIQFNKFLPHIKAALRHLIHKKMYYIILNYCIQ